MDGENSGKPYEQMDDLGGCFPPIFGSTPIQLRFVFFFFEFLSSELHPSPSETWYKVCHPACKSGHPGPISTLRCLGPKNDV